MTARIAALKHLLSGSLPLERVGPHLRHSVKRAIGSQDPDRMTQVARVVVGELIRRGDLLRVAVEGTDGPQGPLYLLRGTSKLLDLSLLEFPLQPLKKPANSPPDGISLNGRTTASKMEDFTDLLGVMEQAQDLDIGNPHSGQSGVILAGILKLLSRLTPQFHLFIQVDDAELVPENQESVFHLEEGEPAEHWLGRRSPGQSFWIPDAKELPRHIRNQDRKVRDDDGAWSGQGITSAVAIPLRNSALVAPGEGDEVGLFFLAAREQWSKEAMLKLARRLGAFVSRRWQRQSEVNQRIHKDRLTGVFNRAYFDDQFTLELERARRSEAPLTLVIADLDHFKAVNDRYGHQVGDLVLERVARRLQNQLRRIDSICRIGGEEFALILPHTSVAAGKDVVKRLLSENPVEEIQYLDETLHIETTFSYGTATFPDGGADAFELYRKADAMLFLSKDKGRNQCHLWSSAGDHVQILPPGNSR